MLKRLHTLSMSLMLTITLVVISFGQVNAQAGTNPGVITLAELGRTEIFLDGPMQGARSKLRIVTFFSDKILRTFGKRNLITKRF